MSGISVQTFIPSAMAERANEIARSARYDGRLQATKLAVGAVARAFFINLPYHISMGTLHALLLFSDEPILEHYWDALLNVAFIALTVIYTAAGLIYPHAFQSFNSAEEPVEELPQPALEIELDDYEFRTVVRKSVDQELEQLRAVAERNGRGGERDEFALRLASQPPVSGKELLRTFALSIGVLQQAIRNNGVREITQTFNIAGQSFTLNFDFTKPNEDRRCLEICKRVLALINQLQHAQPSLHTIQPLLAIEEVEVDDIIDDFQLIEYNRPALHSIGIKDAELFGKNGLFMRRMVHRATLNEYIRLLEDEFRTKISKLISKVDGWGDDRGSQLLYNTLVILNNPKINVRKYDEASGQYRAFVAAHRKLIAYYEKNEVRPEVIEISQAIATVRLKANIQALSEELVAAHISFHEELKANSFHRVFVERNNYVAGANANMKMHWIDTGKRQLWGATSQLDFFSEPDVPNLRGVSVWKGQDGEKRTIPHLRHPTPHIPPSDILHLFKPRIAPEYREFLRGREEAGEGVLYTAYQRLNDTGKEQENPRSQGLIELESKHKNFYLLFHSVENALFKNPKDTFAELKKDLIDSFYDNKAHNANRLPISFQNEEYRIVMEGLFDQVHEIFFNKRDQINPALIDHFGTLKNEQKICEWQTCIMLFYAFQREDMKFRTGLPITSEVNPCKDNFDRGGGQNIISDRLRQHMIYGYDVPKKALEATLSSVQAPPIIGKGIAAIAKRINPSLEVSRLLANLPKDKMDLLQAVRFNGFKLQAYGIEKREGQHALFTPQAARTRREYRDFLEAMKKGSRTIIQNDMVEKNAKVSPDIIDQLNKNLVRSANFTIDGKKWDNSKKAEEILKLLMEKHGLSEERARRVMCQLEVQIFADSMEKLGTAFNRLDWNSTIIKPFSTRPEDVKISLNTTGDHFVITGEHNYKLQDIEEKEDPLAIFTTTVTLRIPKAEKMPETGKWSWKII